MHQLVVNGRFPRSLTRDRLGPSSGGVMTKKHARQEAILALVAQHVVGSQEELRQLLLGRGMDVTQATLSRDLRDLGLARVSTDDGGRYFRPESLADDDGKPLLSNLLPQLLAKLDGGGELMALNTV